MRWLALALALGFLSCGPAESPPAEAVEALPPAPEDAAASAPAPEASETEIPLDRLLELRDDAVATPTGLDPAPRPDGAPAVEPGATSPVPEWLDTEVSGSSESVEVVGPGHTVESTDVGAGVGYRDPESGVAVGVEGRVRDESSEDLEDAEKRDESIRLKVTVPLDRD